MKTTSATDKNYLRLQFWNKVYQKNATEFQSFFEDIMLQAFPDFQKTRPYGKKGDAGNDGYRPDEGLYYQVNAPKNPNEKELEASKKLKNDFNRLKKNWDKIFGNTSLPFEKVHKVQTIVEGEGKNEKYTA